MEFLEVPYTYMREGYRPRHKTPNHQVLSATTIVRVPEVSADQAPVVATCRYSGSRLVQGTNRRFNWQATDGHLDYRLLDGKMMRRAGVEIAQFPSATSNPQGPPGTVLRDFCQARLQVDGPGVGRTTAQAYMNALRAELAHGAPGPMLELPTVKGPEVDKDAPRVMHEADDGFARRLGDNRAQRAAAASAYFAGRIALVDGDLYVPSMGPGWRIMGGAVGSIYEMGHMGHANLEVYAPADQELVALISGKQRLDWQGDIEFDHERFVHMHPDELMSRQLARSYASPGLVAYMTGKVNTGALRIAADIIDMLASTQPCGHCLPQRILELVASIRGSGAEEKVMEYLEQGACIVNNRLSGRARIAGLQSSPPYATPSAIATLA